MGTTVAILLFFWEGLGGWTGSKSRQWGERQERGRHRNSEEATAGRRLVSSWSPDTHSVLS